MLARLALALPLVTVIACAPPTAEESTRSSNSSLTTARPILRVTASTSAKKTLGVTEWRIYKSKKEFVVNGYDAKGYAVKGAAFGFVGSSQSSSSKVRVRLLDGSKASGTYDFRNKPNASGSARSNTAAFLEYAISDLRSVAAQSSGSLKTQGHFLPNGTTGTPADPTIPTTTPAPAGSCAPSLGNLGANGTQCIQSILGALLGGGNGQPNLQSCLSAATSVISNLGTCMGGAGTTASAQDPNAQDPNGADPTEAQGAPNGADPQGVADQASQDDTCASCPAGADDLTVDDQNGGVAVDDQGF